MIKRLVLILLACLMASPVYAGNTRQKGVAFTTRFILLDVSGAAIETGTPVVTVNTVASTNAASFANGYWSLLLTTSEADADEVVILADHPDSAPVLLSYAMWDDTDTAAILADADTAATQSTAAAARVTTGIPDAAPNAAGGLLTFGTGSGQLNPSSGKVTAATVEDKTGYGLADGAITAAKFGANAIAAATLDSDVTTELQSGLLTSSEFTTTIGTPDVDLATDIAAIDAGSGGDPVSPDVVGDSYTWFGKRYRASNIIEVESGYVGPLALAPDMNPGVTIATVDSVSIVSGMTSVTATDLSVDRSRTRAVFTVPALNTEGTYTVRVKVTTVEGQEITTVCTMKVY